MIYIKSFIMCLLILCFADSSIGQESHYSNYSIPAPWERGIISSSQAFARDPKLVWQWYSWRIGLILEKEPNLAHYALVALQNAGFNCWVITQNVDDLHRRAGSKNILQVHGDILRAWCQKCGESIILDAAPEKPPVCNCGNLMRPGVVWFGESLDYQVLSKAEEILANHCDVLLVVGTSGLVYPAAGFPMIAKRKKVIIIEFNINETPISSISDVVILGKSEETLPLFIEGILKDLLEE